MFAISLCDGEMVKYWNGIHSHMIGVTFGVTFFLFHFCHDSDHWLQKIFIWKCSIVANHCNWLAFPTSLYIIIIWGIHTRSFIQHVKFVQKISSTFEYVKIDRHIICNWIFLRLCHTLCVFLYIYNVLWLVFLCRAFVDNDAFWFVLVHGTALQ